MYLKYLSIKEYTREEAAAFGDGENDIEMLRYVQEGIAMGNADDFVKSVADYVTADIDDNGNVSVNGVALKESYLKEKSLKPTDIEFPYQVPDDRYFVLGDHRSVSIDSRSSTVGCVSEEQLIGKVVFRVYPFSAAGSMK